MLVKREATCGALDQSLASAVAIGWPVRCLLRLIVRMRLGGVVAMVVFAGSLRSGG